MTTAARPLPAHGTYARANGSPRYRKPCKCEPCLIVRRRSDKQWKVNRALGRSLWTDSAEAREHLKTLRTTRTWASIAAAAQVTPSGLYSIANGQRTTIHRKTHARILAVQPLAKPTPSRHIDALGTRRRLQALMVIGHSIRTIAQASAVARDRVHHIAMGLQPTVRCDVAGRITAAYERLAFRPPAKDKFTNRTRNLAAARGWHGPLDWDDIDDPQCQPETGRRRQDGPGRREKVDDQQVARLTAQGLTAEQIARELRCHKRTVVRARGRAQDMATAA